MARKLSLLKQMKAEGLAEMDQKKHLQAHLTPPARTSENPARGTSGGVRDRIGKANQESRAKTFCATPATCSAIGIAEVAAGEGALQT